MYTRCPQCRTAYQINAAQLRCGRGEAICDRCNLIFGALENLGETLEEALADHTSCLLELPQLQQGIATAPEVMPPPQTEKVEPVLEPELEEALDDGFPSKIADRYWTATALILALLLGAQVFAWVRKRAVDTPSLYPAVAWGCRLLGCEPPPFQDLAALKVIDRALYPTKDREGYEFHLVLVNKAAYPQAYPLLKLTLTALDGTPIAQRVFKPEKYLRASSPGPMPSHQPLFIDLALASPKREAGGFQFEFLK